MRPDRVTEGIGEVFLFDEPLSNLDAKLRVETRANISKLHQQLQTTFIYVTHDQVEAMTMADRIVVLDRGMVAADFPKERYSLNELMDIMREIASTGHFEPDRTKAAPTDEAASRIYLLRDFDEESPTGSEVPDPYYGGGDGFEQVLEICEAACRGLLDYVRERHLR